ncbi:hypothetical protein HGRIS_012135 [Hohenbuehelia grisea]|uniref:Cytochrome P450 n=1 Tax=Hohenbuehelia grisea TaxID=104357 RepID=A0ABR3IRF0_9AGAR
MPRESEWKTYYRWGLELKSDVIHIPVLGMNIVVLNSSQAVDDLLEKRSAIYASRPRMPMLVEVMKFKNLSMLPYGDLWKDGRRLCQRELHPALIKRYRPVLTKYTNMFLRSLIETPKEWRARIRHLTGASVLEIAYGLDIKATGDPYVELAQKGMRGVESAVVPGAFLVDLVPWLQRVPDWLPGAGWKKQANIWRDTLEDMNEIPYNAAKEQIRNGSTRLSYVSSCLEKIEESEDISYQDKIIKDTAGTMYAGNSDTSAAVLANFVLAMVDNPEVVRKAQEEIDRVVGHNRLPTMDDHDSLPYVVAIVKESIRWRTVVPISIPHLVTQDDIYKGYFIPEGSIIIPNIWAILHDEHDYPDPFTFNPDRFMKGGELNPDAKDPTASFGHGRRICPGRFLAHEELFSIIVSTLVAFDFTKAVGDDGELIEPCHDEVPGALCSPASFECSLKPRSLEAQNLVMATGNR